MSSRSRRACTSQKSIGSMTLSTSRRVGSSWKNWNTTPTVRPRQAAAAFSDSADTSTSPTTTRPAVGRSIPAIMFNRVDLPDPEGPTTATNSPAPKVRSTASSAVNGTAPDWYVRVTASSRTSSSVRETMVRSIRSMPGPWVRRCRVAR